LGKLVKPGSLALQE